MLFTIGNCANWTSSVVSHDGVIDEFAIHLDRHTVNIRFHNAYYKKAYTLDFYQVALVDFENLSPWGEDHFINGITVESNQQRNDMVRQRLNSDQYHVSWVWDANLEGMIEVVIEMISGDNIHISCMHIVVEETDIS